MITLALYVLFLAIAGILLYFGSKNNVPVWIMGCILLMGIGIIFLYGEADISDPIGENISTNYDYNAGYIGTSVFNDINHTSEEKLTVYQDVNVSNNVLLQSASYFFVFGGFVGLLIAFGMLWRQFG